MKCENFIALFEKSLKENTKKAAFIEYHGDSVTYEVLAKRINAYHNHWREIGLSKGDKIAICGKNSCRWAELYLAIVSGGYVAVLFPTDLPFDSYTRLLSFSDCRCLYCDDDLLSFAKTNKKIGIEFVYNIRSTIFSLESKKPSLVNLEFAKVSPEDLCTILFTTGSTGFPKGCMLSVRNISFGLETHDHPFAADEDNYVNLFLPFYHIFGLTGMLILPVCFGAQSIILTQPPTPQNICSILQRYKPLFISVVPFIIKKLIEYIYKCPIEEIILEGEKQGSFKEIRDKFVKELGGNIQVIYSGGTAMPPDVESFLCKKIQFPCISGYGLSETGCITQVSLSQSFRSCGTIHPDCHVRILSNNPHSVPGEIQVFGDNVFLGYYKNDTATRSAFTSDKWFHTGDLGVFDEYGFLYIVGRCKDIIITSNGENIYPGDIEYELNLNPYIKESLLTKKEDKLHAIIVIDRNQVKIDNISDIEVLRQIEISIAKANNLLPGFSFISSYSLRNEFLERTEKGELKRMFFFE